MDFGRPKQMRQQDNGGIIKDATSATFAADVIEASRSVPVIVDFWASWCNPCKQLTPILEKVVMSYGGKVRLVKVDVDSNQAIAAQLRIQSLPTVYAFVDGQLLDGFMGVQPESTVRQFVDRLAGDNAAASEEDEIANVLATGNELLEAGDLQSAAEVFAAILKEDRSNAEALAGLAQCYLRSGDIERARQTIELVAPDKQNQPAVQSVVAGIELAEKAGSAGDLGMLAARLQADPQDHQARFDLAVGLAARDQRAEALDQLLELIRRSRTWNEEAARKQLLQLFEVWGPKEPLVAEGRRRLSSILFS